MVNFSLNLASMVGIAVAIGGAALYAVRSVRPELSRDYDLFFAAVALLCGGILFFYGWRFDPIMQFGQILLGGSAIFFALENLRLRGVTTAQAKRSAPIVDEERPVSRVYRVDAELDDQIELEEEESYPPRLRGDRDSRLSRTQAYEEPGRRRPPSRSNGYDRPSSEDLPPKRRTRPSEGTTNGKSQEWEARLDREQPPQRRRPSGSVNRKPAAAASSTRSDRPSEERPPRRNRDDVEATPTDYVDYQPIDPKDDDLDNSGNFDY